MKLNNHFADIFQRDLQKLQDELNAFKNEANIWNVAPGVTNSAGNLTLHLMGNINHFIGATLGNTGYVRQRDLEFSTNDVSREQLLADLTATALMAGNVLSGLTDAQLEAEFPFELFGKHATAYYLMHFYGHLSYHLGQINYLRRMLES